MGTQEPARGRRAVVLREQRLAGLARRQHGVLSRGQLLDAGLSVRTIHRRVEAGRLRRLHRGVYAFGNGVISQHGRWVSAVLACGDDGLLSHRSAAELWGLRRSRQGPIDVTSTVGRARPGITVHEGGVDAVDRTTRDRIPVTTVARTLFDLAEVVGERQLERAFEEADRLGLLRLQALQEVCARGEGRHALRPIRRLIDAARAPTFTRSALEDRFARLCREHGLAPFVNVEVLGHEVDAYWSAERLVVELDGFAFHRHRAAFERDRARDAALQAEGYRVVRVTHRRLEREPDAVAKQIRRLLGATNGGRADG